MSPLLTYVQAAVMARPAALTEQATLDELQKPYVVVARSAAAQLSDKAMLLRYSQAVGQAVKVFRPQLNQQQHGVTLQQPITQHEPKGERALSNPAPPKQQKAPEPKRRGPKLG
ncbi:hypothetical protein FDY95_24495 [Hymenobacter jeollabukensis]|uniref:Uncharacterized protein n=2 Tax=Hymenobacter jeollabukensis TaxID=2025313 RepID=A0A5R8WJ94_9BACT|nr:hypothetical protein FDY95_24495 [Hymenobacter jeollabukensis]